MESSSLSSGAQVTVSISKKSDPHDSGHTNSEDDDDQNKTRLLKPEQNLLELHFDIID